MDIWSRARSLSGWVFHTSGDHWILQCSKFVSSMKHARSCSAVLIGSQTPRLRLVLPQVWLIANTHLWSPMYGMYGVVYMSVCMHVCMPVCLCVCILREPVLFYGRQGGGMPTKSPLTCTSCRVYKFNYTYSSIYVILCVFVRVRAV